MYAAEKSDTVIVPKKEPNKVALSVTAEALEGRAVAKGNSVGADCELYAETGGRIGRA